MSWSRDIVASKCKQSMFGFRHHFNHSCRLHIFVITPNSILLIVALHTEKKVTLTLTHRAVRTLQGPFNNHGTDNGILKESKNSSSSSSSSSIRHASCQKSCSSTPVGRQEKQSRKGTMQEIRTVSRPPAARPKKALPRKLKQSDILLAAEVA